jgi:hypothetical protein
MKIDKKLGQYLLELLEYEALSVYERRNEGTITAAQATEDLYWIDEAKKALGVTSQMATPEIQQVQRLVRQKTM